jgi:hypothetical protein
VKTAVAVAPLRASRGAVFAGTALGLAAAAHLAGGGRLPGVTALLLLAVPVAWAAFFLTRARRGWPIVISSLLAVEAGLHAGLSLLSGPVAHVAPIPMAVDGPMMTGAHTMVMTHTEAALTSGGGMSGMPLVPSLGMILAHLAATVLTGAALAHGEQLLWCLWTWLHHAVTIFADLVVLPLPRPLLAAWPLTASPVPVLVDRSVRRRGPPRRVVGRPVSA